MRKGVQGEKRGEGGERRRYVHEEKEHESRVIAANQLRSRIPTDVLSKLQLRSNLSLDLLMDDDRAVGDLRSYVEWEREWRRANGVLLIDTFDDRGAMRIEDYGPHSTRS